MSELKQKDLRTPIGSEQARKLRGVIGRAFHEQAAAATAAGAAAVGGTPAPHSGVVQSVFLVSKMLAAAGESLVIDVLKNGASILSATLTFDSSKAKGEQIDLPFVAGTQINAGDLLTVSRTYVAGGGPTMTATVVGIEWA